MKMVNYTAQPQYFTPALQTRHMDSDLQIGATAAQKSSATPVKPQEPLL